MLSVLPKNVQPVTFASANFFTHPNWVYELKYDGFRALALIEKGNIALISKKGFAYKRFPDLCNRLASAFRAREVILDGEIVCVDSQGRPRFYDLMFRRGEPCFFAFDILWKDGKDLRGLSLLMRKKILEKLIPQKHSHVLYVDYVEDGDALYRLVCEQDLEGIVMKPKASLYEKNRWVKVKNPDYSQAKGRDEIFDRT